MNRKAPTSLETEPGVPSVSAQNYVALLGAISDHVFFIDSKGIVTFVKAATHCLDPKGMNRHVGYDLSVGFGEEFSTLVRKAIDLSQADGISFPVNYEGDYGRGPRVLSAQVMALKGGGAFLTLRNRTEEAEIRESARLSEDLNRRLLEAIPDPIFYVSGEGVYLGFKAVDERELLVPPSQFLGKTIRDVFPPEISNLHMDAISRALASGAIQTFVYRSPSREAHFEVRVVPQGANDVVEIVRDVTAKTRHELAMAAANDALDKRVSERTAELMTANMELESFCYSASHDLRAPLRSINGFSTLLLQDYEALFDEEGADYLNRIRRATVRMDQIISEMLLLAGVVRAPMIRAEVNVSSICSEIAAELDATDPSHPTTWIIQAGMRTQGDQKLIRTALENLLGNAHKFTRPVDDAEIIVDCDDSVFRVNDNGVGFDSKYAGSLFQAFGRLHTYGEFPGNGIGLATVKRIVERHGGKVWGEGRVGVGATFWFTLKAD